MQPRQRGRKFAIVIACAGLLFCGLGCAGPQPRWHIEREARLEDHLRDSPGKPLLVVDLDDTVVHGGAWNSTRLVLGLCYNSVEPLPDAAPVLQELENHWNLIFLTARDDSVAGRTVAWLDKHDFPQVPVVFSSRWLLSHLKRADYKTQVIASLADRGLHIACGIGDKASDFMAYTKNGGKTVLLLDGYDDPDFPGTLEAIGRKTYSPHLDEPIDLDLVIFDPDTSWQIIRQNLDRDGHLHR